MREIKFRAWDKNIEVMTDPENLHLDGSGLVSIYYQSCNDEESGWSNEIQDIVLQQYTGLKDKNGKEIYAGDLIQSTYIMNGKPIKLRVKEVFWDEETAGFRTRPESPFASIDLTTDEHIEIIGNIYEKEEK